MDDLLRQFVSQECTPEVRQLLLEAIEGSEESNFRFEFNRFEVSVEKARAVVVLEDVLDATEAGSRRIPIAEFLSAVVRGEG